MSQIDMKIDKSKILRTVPYEQGFHFATEKGASLGVTATSLSDLADKLETIDINSIMFHYLRGDFQKWIQDTLGDKALSNQMCFVKQDASGEKVRKQLHRMVQKRVAEIQNQK